MIHAILSRVASIRSVPFWHFWNPHSGLLGGFIAAAVAFAAFAAGALVVGVMGLIY